MTEITDPQMAQGARMSIIAWRHPEEIRMGAPTFGRICFSVADGFGRFAAGDVERAMRSHDGIRRKRRQSRQTAAQPEALLLH